MMHFHTEILKMILLFYLSPVNKTNVKCSGAVMVTAPSALGKTLGLPWVIQAREGDGLCWVPSWREERI